MTKIFESVPNISEGRDNKIIEACVDEIRKTNGCKLLHYTSDVNHNRTVITYVGTFEGCKEASLRLVKKAKALIDLNKQKGEHPRVGAVDVMPFIPVKEASMDDCVNLARHVGEKIAKEDIPVYFYENAASSERRKNLAHVRKGQFEGLTKKMKETDWKPDIGSAKPHPTFGTICIGARNFLIAYNIDLDTSDLSIARDIASKIRESNGGLPGIKAMGVMLESRNVAQVSINIVDYHKTSIYAVQEKVRELASQVGIKILNGELIGMAPAEALLDSLSSYLQLESFQWENQTLDLNL